MVHALQRDLADLRMRDDDDGFDDDLPYDDIEGHGTGAFDFYDDGSGEDEDADGGMW